MPDGVCVLVVDDENDVRGHLCEVLAHAGLTTLEASSGGAARGLLEREAVDVVIVDIRLPDGSGLEILRWVRGADLDTEVIVLTGYADVETAVQAMRLGAYDFLTKPWHNAELVEVIGKAAEKKALRRENSALREVVSRAVEPEIVGETAEMRELVALATRVAATDTPVLIHGESGTGKELVARMVHLRSRRAGRPFVTVNCAAVPDTLLESELFGHKRGAFSGAVATRIGLFEAADGGTLFLDEIGDMSPAMQVRMLRVLDAGEVRRVGDERTFRVDTRVVAATAKDLAPETAAGRFRSDLYYRVSTVVIEVPPLRRRAADVPLLIRHFAAATAGRRRPLRFSNAAMERLVAYEWRGNVRELSNLIERLQILHQGEEVALDDLPPEIRERRTGEGTADRLLVSLHEVERHHVERVLAATAWNKTRAARVLEVDIKTLNKKIRDYGLSRPA